MRKILVSLIFFSLVINVYGIERVRKKMADGKYRFFDKVSEFKYDERGNTIYSHGENKGEQYFKYDDSNNLINDGIYDYTYDNKGHLLTKKRSYNEFIDEEYKYDENGNKIVFIKRNDEYTSPNIYYYEYNDKGKLVKITMRDNRAVALFDYDENGNMIYEYNPFEEDSNGYIREYIYEYDDKNRVVCIIDNKNNEIKLNYDEKGNLIEKLYHDSYYNRYFEYDDNNRLLTEKNGNNDIELSYKYNDDGLIIEEFSKENDENNSYTYNEKGLIINKTVKRYYGTTDYVYEYEYYDNGDVKSVCEYKYSGGRY